MSVNAACLAASLTTELISQSTISSPPSHHAQFITVYYFGVEVSAPHRLKEAIDASA